jgi:hypothetical protein
MPCVRQGFDCLPIVACLPDHDYGVPLPLLLVASDRHAAFRHDVLAGKRTLRQGSDCGNLATRLWGSEREPVALPLFLLMKTLPKERLGPWPDVS